ncbi:hypothetical protein [Magnetospira sp. QH-2]|uniref:hypothetical protein n=1 Tax=Magnetospira sp. (strain QH-2) TaxID=1288970 RepID=UPI0003E811D0|nr:hypothetical protein [Magnetospira sp. QH-2]CCQ73270.1 Conserved protein of unknown function [Magnetospira sp. QH-2]
MRRTLEYLIGFALVALVGAVLVVLFGGVILAALSAALAIPLAFPLTTIGVIAVLAGLWAWTAFRRSRKE